MRIFSPYKSYNFDGDHDNIFSSDNEENETIPVKKSSSSRFVYRPSIPNSLSKEDSKKNITGLNEKSIIGMLFHLFYYR